MSEIVRLFRDAPHVMCGVIILAAILGASISYLQNAPTIAKLDAKIADLKAQQDHMTSAHESATPIPAEKDPVTK
jgi:type VI protein secretion system component VasK